MSWGTLISSSSISFTYSAIQWFPRKFVTTDFTDCQEDSSASLSVSSNIVSSMSSLIERPSNIQTLTFSTLIHSNFSRGKARPQHSLSIAKFFVSPNLMCKDESRIFSVRREGETERNAKQVLNLVLTAILYDIMLFVRLAV